ncbi:uncharacterized protein BCR38DRAFT_476559 [Pseudomassariella vexata]|uniref:Alcohol dehydrogenase-like N-terminal domain-containing protein n=1 Tax=Pseudomassariella vexata TaxID=1141098 RepID=A0A1Y2DPP2_9PEZI|nr:uncharacterized protein BCR38DRAFT_476559 [Pseudomassariella vexata]ORY60635.1 hypothetical protein BCR38DRAFT_476559 [Pseudomassariella vexata]
MGSDVASTVVEVGSNVTRFKVGDRVLGHALGMEKKYDMSAMCGLQLYIVLFVKMTSPIPDALQFERATTVPARNFELVKSLGAKKAFDHKSKTVVQDIVRECQGVKMAEAMSIGDGAAEGCVKVLGQCEGNSFISQVRSPTPKNKDAGGLVRAWCFMSSMALLWVKGKSNGVRTKFVWVLESRFPGRSPFVYALEDPLYSFFGTHNILSAHTKSKAIEDNTASSKSPALNLLKYSSLELEDMATYSLFARWAMKKNMNTSNRKRNSENQAGPTSRAKRSRKTLLLAAWRAYSHTRSQNRFEGVEGDEEEGRDSVRNEDHDNNSVYQTTAAAAKYPREKEPSAVATPT